MSNSRLIGSRVAAVVLVLLCAVILGHAEDVVLRVKFVPQQEIVYDIWATGVATISIPGMPLLVEEEGVPGEIQAQFNANGSLSLYVTSVDEEGNATVGVRLGTLRLQGQAMGESDHMAMDSAKGIGEFDGDRQQIRAGELQQIRRWRGDVTATIAAELPLPEEAAEFLPGPIGAEVSLKMYVVISPG